jgi:hypothetical protein
VARRLLYLLAGSLVFWLLVTLPARRLGGGDLAVLYTGTALAICLVPTLATLVWAQWAWHRSPQHQLAAVMGGMGLRMAFVLVLGWTLYQFVPYYQEQLAFWIWLLVFYLFTLALDMTLLLAGRPTVRS